MTISYLTMIGIGMLFNYHKYEEYGINIFEYSDLFDYLIAPFEDVQIFIFSLLTMIVTFGFIRLDIWLKKNYPVVYSRVNFGWDKKSWFTQYRVLSFVVLFLAYLYISADIYGEMIKKEIDQGAPISLKYLDNSYVEGILIGKTSEVLFLKQAEKVIAVPYSSVVKEIEIK